MDIGRLDRPILIERPTETRNEYNEPVITWVEYSREFASVLDVLAGSREATNQDIRLTKRPVKVCLRYRNDITTDMRITILDRGRILQIVTPPAEIGRKEALEIICEEFSS